MTGNDDMGGFGCPRPLDACGGDRCRDGRAARGRGSGGAASGWCAWLAGCRSRCGRCYEAGPTGFALYRAARGGRDRDRGDRAEQDAAGARRPGQDRSQGRRAAGAAAAGRPADGGRGAPPERRGGPPSRRAREQVRARSDARRHRVSKLLLRHGRVYPERDDLDAAHRRWLAAPALRAAGDRARLPRRARRRRRAASPARPRSTSALSRLAHDERVVADRRSAALLPRDRHADRVRALHSSSATGTASRAPRQLAAWLGLVPARPVRREPPARARSPRPAPATPAGCWSSRPGTTCAPPRIGATLANRQARPARPRPPDRLARPAPPPPPHTRLRERGKPHNVATVAVARELACFLWAAATAD